MELVGMSRVDKPSVSEQLQPILPEPHTSSLGSTPSTTGSRPGQDTLRPEPGLRYQDTIDPDSSPRARIRYVPARKHLPTGMYAAVACSTEQSHCLDETPLDESILPAWSVSSPATRSLGHVCALHSASPSSGSHTNPQPAPR